MTFNVGSTDRIIRAILGIGIIVFAVLSHGSIRWVGIVGAVLLITAIVRYCPAYSIVGINTCSTRKN